MWLNRLCKIRSYFNTNGFKCLVDFILLYLSLKCFRFKYPYLKFLLDYYGINWEKMDCVLLKWCRVPVKQLVENLSYHALHLISSFIYINFLFVFSHLFLVVFCHIMWHPKALKTKFTLNIFKSMNQTYLILFSCSNDITYYAWNSFI